MELTSILETEWTQEITPALPAWASLAERKCNNLTRSRKDNLTMNYSPVRQLWVCGGNIDAQAHEAALPSLCMWYQSIFPALANEGFTFRELLTHSKMPCLSSAQVHFSGP